MKKILIIPFLFSITAVSGQYWFGPKVGVSYSDHIYQENTYERDSFNVDNDLNFQAGFAFAYTATDLYSVYGEIVYEQVGKKIKDDTHNGDFVEAQMVNHFISVPVLFRVTLGRGAFKYYVNGGPRLSYWLGGSGSNDLEANRQNGGFVDDEGNPLPTEQEFKLTFNSAKEEDRTVELVKDPNRLQFGLAVGGGMLFDLANGSRLMLDLRYTWSHSNMAQNSSLDGNVYGSVGDEEYYRENWEYSRNYAAISIGYLIGYNSDLKRKGKSSNTESNKKKK